MSKSNVTYSREQLEYIKDKFSVHINTIIDPNTSINTIMHNAGIIAVIKSIEERTHGMIPLTPR